MDVIVIETTQLGDRSYLVHDGSVALVIDPQRDTDRVEAAARDAGVTITHVAETHIHNDYLTGGLELARAHGASYLVNAADPVTFERQPITDGQTVRVGALTVKAVATPGHTHTHLSFIVDDGGQQAVFSGGSLLYGSVGRTDLVGAEDTLGLTHDQYASVRRLAGEAAPDAALFPTHGFGSFCSSGPASGAGSSTIGEQLTSNHALTDPDEDHFVQELIANLTAYPSYYAHMGVTNAAGPGPADLTVPESLDAAELMRRLEAGEWVVDLRRRVAFASSHLKGSVSFEYGDQLQHLPRLGAAVGRAADPRRIPRRRGERHPRPLPDRHRLPRRRPRHGPARPGAPRRRRLLSPRGLGRRARRPGAGGATPSSTCAGPTSTPPRGWPGRSMSRCTNCCCAWLNVPAGKLWVHCTSGYRAGIAASLLQRAGRDVVHIDAKFDDAEAAGIPLDERRRPPPA